MNAISVRRLDPELHAWLQEQAAAHGVSMEEQVRRVLRAARDAAEAERSKQAEERWQALSDLAIKPAPGSPSSTEILRQMRDEG